MAVVTTVDAGKLTLVTWLAISVVSLFPCVKDERLEDAGAGSGA